jgi:uncharacterized protein (DUF1800 family)
MDANRLATARLFQRFGFGPRPGEFSAALSAGFSSTRTNLLTPPGVDQGALRVRDLGLTDLGRRPDPNDPRLPMFAAEMKEQNKALAIWWLDLMTLSDHSLTERMTWFWHGHWATAIDKLNFALPMYLQNQTLRKHALGNFRDMSLAMIKDGALQFWLDGQENTSRAPNENLARELMELFILGVNRYTEEDVRELARALTGYQVVRSNGTVSFNLRRYDPNLKTILGKTIPFDADTATGYLVDQKNCQLFIAERLWFRFISSQQALPKSSAVYASFGQRSISSAVSALSEFEILADFKYSIVKSPVEWFIASCRALSITPSQLNNRNQLLNFLTKLAQVPFNPPNVGGWPTDEAWLSSASAQFRFTFATWLIKQGDTSPVANLARGQRVDAVADWLGVAEISDRTKFAMQDAAGDPRRLILLALCSPEFIVSA